MEVKEQNIEGRVRENTSDDANQNIDQKVINNITRYSNRSSEEITERLEKLQKEWDIERILEVNASSLVLASLVFGILGKRKWFILTGVVGGFLLQHGIQGWCPPLPVFRALGIRTRREIDEEIYALKTLRGDFDELSTTTPPEKIINSFRS
jgi:hypothetical protein